MIWFFGVVVVSAWLGPKVLVAVDCVLRQGASPVGFMISSLVLVARTKTGFGRSSGIQSSSCSGRTLRASMMSWSSSCSAMRRSSVRCSPDKRDGSL